MIPVSRKIGQGFRIGQAIDVTVLGVKQDGTVELGVALASTLPHPEGRVRLTVDDEVMMLPPNTAAAAI